MIDFVKRFKPGEMRPNKPTHKYRYDQGVWMTGWVIGKNPFNTDEVVFLNLDGEITTENCGIVQAIGTKPVLVISDDATISALKGLINTLDHLTPATRAPIGVDQNSPPYNPGIGAGMLNTLIGYAKKLKHLIP